MTINLLDLYNSAATQEWSMYDNDAANGEELESALVLALNKAIVEILYSYPFNFRERTHVILTLPDVNTYDLPPGLINRDDNGNYMVKLNSKLLSFVESAENLDSKIGIPDRFYIKSDKIVFYPKPVEKSLITIDYTTLAIGEDADGNEIFALKNPTDTLTVPTHLEELMKNAVIARTMLNSIASEGDENYSAYKKQSEVAYRLLIKYSKGVGLDKAIKF